MPLEHGAKDGEVQGQAARLEMLEGQARLAAGRAGAGANSGPGRAVLSATDAVAAQQWTYAAQLIEGADALEQRHALEPPTPLVMSEHLGGLRGRKGRPP